MPANIFNRTASQVEGVFVADGVSLTINGGVMSLVQQLQISYQQAISRIFEVGSANLYYVGGRATGNATFQRIIGPAGGLCAFYKQYGDVCGAIGRNLVFGLGNGGCSTTPNDTYTLTSVVLQSVQISVTANDIIVSDMAQLVFAALEC
jgi:hypothetical protein